jgi:hypothetical protein
MISWPITDRVDIHWPCWATFRDRLQPTGSTSYSSTWAAAASSRICPLDNARWARSFMTLK